MSTPAEFVGPTTDMVAPQPRTVEDAVRDYNKRQQARADLREQMAMVEEQQRKQRERDNLKQFAVDLFTPAQALRGALNATAETVQMLADMGQVGPRINIHIPGTAPGGEDLLAATARVAKEGINAAIPKSETTAGQLTESIGGFLSYFLPLNEAAGTVALAERATPLVGKTIGKFIGGAAAGAVTDFSVFDPAQENLDALLKNHAGLKNPVTEFLATDPNDEAAVNRFRNALEGFGLGSAVEGAFVTSMKVMRLARFGKAAARAEDDVRAAAREETLPEPVKAPEEPVQEPAASTNNGQGQSVDRTTMDLSQPEPPPAEGAPAVDLNNPRNILTPGVRRDMTPQQGEAMVGTLQSPTAQVSTAIRATGQQGLTDFNAGTIDWKSFGNSADDIYNVLETTSRVFEQNINEAKGGVQTLAETQRLAELTGGTVEGVSKLFASVRGEGGIAAKLMAANQVMLASAQRVKGLATEVLAGATDKTAELYRAVEQHAAIQAAVKGSQTEVARALHSLRKLKNAAEGVDFGDLGAIDKKLVKKLANTSKIADLNQQVRKAAGLRWHDYALEVWINGLLTGPTTHMANFLSNAVKAAVTIPESALAAGIGKGRQLLGQTGERVRIQEALSRVVGLVQGTVDALRYPVRQAGDKVGEVGNVWKTLKSGKSTVAAGSKLEADRLPALKWDVPDSGAGRVTAQIGNAIGSIVRSPGAALQGSDEWFKSIAYRQELHALATRRALEAADKVTSVTAGHREAVASTVYDSLVKAPPEDLHLAAIDYAKRQTFTNQPGNVAKGLNALLHFVPAGRFILPFVSTPANIIRDFVRYTPLELANINNYRGELGAQMRRGGAEADLAIAKVMLGSGALWWAYHQAQAGNIIGGGPSGRDTTELSGVKPYSIRVGDKWYAFNRLEPVGTLIGTAADLHDLYKNLYEAKGDATKLEDATQAALLAIVKNASSKTWLAGVSSAMQAFTDPDRGYKWFDKFGASLLPFVGAFRAGTAVTDDHAREAFSLMDQLRAEIPTVSNGLPLKRDYLGRPVEQNRSSWNPIYVSEASKDPVDQEVSRLAYQLEMPDKKIAGVPLTAAQYSRMLELQGTTPVNGKTLHQALAEVIESPQYKNSNDTRRVLAVKRLVQGFAGVGQKGLLKEDPKLLKQVTDAMKLAKGYPVQ